MDYDPNSSAKRKFCVFQGFLLLYTGKCKEDSLHRMLFNPLENAQIGWS